MFTALINYFRDIRFLTISLEETEDGILTPDRLALELGIPPAEMWAALHRLEAIGYHIDILDV